MPAYVVVDVDVTDPEAYARYRDLAGSAVTAHGGRYLARGGATTVLEGGWDPARLVLLEFPDAESARRWYASPEYRQAIDARQGAATVRMVVVEGVE